MKKISYIALCLLAVISLTGCGSQKSVDKEPEISQIRAICNLATLETQYHNVAKVKKGDSGGLGSLFQKERVMWIEYTGIARIGIDMSEVDMKINGENVTVYLPEAKVLNKMDISESKIDKDSYYRSEDNKLFFKNTFTAEDETKAINEAQNNMRRDIENNSQLLKRAQDRAKDLIEQYIEELGLLTGKNYKIDWVYEEIKNGLTI